MAGPPSEARGPSEDIGMARGRHCGAAGPTPDETGRYPGNPIPAGRSVASALIVIITMWSELTISQALGLRNQSCKCMGTQMAGEGMAKL